MRNFTKTMMNILFAVATEINYGIFKIFVKLLVFKKIQQDCRYIKKIINVKIIKKAILFKRQIRICTYFSWSILTLFRMGFFGATHGWGGGGGRPKRSPLPKTRHTYPKMMKLTQWHLTQRRSKKYMNHVTHLLSYADISIFSLEISKFSYIKKYRFRLYFDP